MQVQETIEGWRCVLYECNLGKPSQRCVCAAVVTAGAMYALGYPKSAFREDGSMRDVKETGYRKHFLLTQVVLGVAVGLLT